MFKPFKANEFVFEECPALTIRAFGALACGPSLSLSLSLKARLRRAIRARPSQETVYKTRKFGIPIDIGNRQCQVLKAWLIKYKGAKEKHKCEPRQKERQGGGIEPLHVSMPLELKSSPSTSLTHPGSREKNVG